MATVLYRPLKSKEASRSGATVHHKNGLSYETCRVEPNFINAHLENGWVLDLDALKKPKSKTSPKPKGETKQRKIFDSPLAAEAIEKKA